MEELTGLRQRLTDSSAAGIVGSGNSEPPPSPGSSEYSVQTSSSWQDKPPKNTKPAGKSLNPAFNLRTEPSWPPQVIQEVVHVNDVVRKRDPPEGARKRDLNEPPLSEVSVIPPFAAPSQGQFDADVFLTLKPGEKPALKKRPSSAPAGGRRPSSTLGENSVVQAPWSSPGVPGLPCSTANGSQAVDQGAANGGRVFMDGCWRNPHDAPRAATASATLPGSTANGRQAVDQGAANSGRGRVLMDGIWRSPHEETHAAAAASASRSPSAVGKTRSQKKKASRRPCSAGGQSTSKSAKRASQHASGAYSDLIRSCDLQVTSPVALAVLLTPQQIQARSSVHPAIS